VATRPMEGEPSMERTDGPEDDAEHESGDPGIAMTAISRLKLSDSVRSILMRAQLARENQTNGLLGTGLVLLALEEIGRADRSRNSVAASTIFVKILDDVGSGGFPAARMRFLEANRRAGAGKPGTANISRSLYGALQYAANLPSHDGTVAGRHLVVALLAHRPLNRREPTNAVRLLRDAEIDPAVLLSRFMESLVRGGPVGEREGWDTLALQNGWIPASTPSELAQSPARKTRPAGMWIAGYGSDKPTGNRSDDCLSIESTVAALANLIVSPKLEGNLSLGVFGNWGSGKSFFMRSLRATIDDLSRVARHAEPPGNAKAPTVWPNVVQVEFNAWHYVDANLWASLMSHLLGELWQWTPEGENAERPAHWAALDNLGVATESRNEAKKRKDEAEKALHDAEAHVSQARKQRDADAKELTQAISRTLWKTVEEKLGKHPDLGVEAIVPKLKELGVTSHETKESLQLVHARLKDLTTPRGAATTIAAKLLEADLRTFVIRVALTMGLLLAAMFVGSIYVDQLRGAGVWLGSTAAGLLAVLTQGVTWVKTHASSAAEVLKTLAEKRRAIDQELERAELEKAANVASREQALAASQTALETAESTLAQREEALRIAQERLKEALTGRAIRRFLENRLASGDYQKHLGLIALIRRDFEQLSQLIEAYNAHRLGLGDATPKIRAALRRARPDIEEQDLDQYFEQLGINRIVLYIDDLDRCPSDRVVEVLQAIHLLLSFDVFVVVVGVDSRWMAHSLAKEFPACVHPGECP